MGKLVLLKSQEDFENFRRSKSYDAPLLKIRVRQGVNQNLPRFGFIIPKKVLPKVVDRNLLKRRMKSFLSKNVAKFRSDDVLIFPKAQMLKAKVLVLEKELTELFGKARLWK
jgi:ribonuclease P protein component